MNGVVRQIVDKIDYKRVTPEQRARLEPHIQLPEVQKKLVLELLDVKNTIDVMSGRVRRCLDILGIQVFDTIVAEREQKRLLVEKLRHRQGKVGNGNKMAKR